MDQSIQIQSDVSHRDFLLRSTVQQTRSDRGVMITTLLLIIACIAAGNLVHHHHRECGERRRDPRACRELP
jgi:hypothetical protein